MSKRNYDDCALSAPTVIQSEIDDAVNGIIDKLCLLYNDHRSTSPEFTAALTPILRLTELVNTHFKVMRATADLESILYRRS